MNGMPGRHIAEKEVSLQASPAARQRPSSLPLGEALPDDQAAVTAAGRFGQRSPPARLGFVREKIVTGQR